MSQVIGYRNVKFTGNDGKEVSGVSVYLTTPIDEKYGKGYSTDKIFLSASLVEKISYIPVVGTHVEVEYNRWGRVSGIKVQK